MEIKELVFKRRKRTWRQNGNSGSWLGVCAFKQVGLLKQRRDQVRKKHENERRGMRKKNRLKGCFSGMLRLHHVRFSIFRDRNNKWVHMK